MKPYLIKKTDILMSPSFNAAVGSIISVAGLMPSVNATVTFIQYIRDSMSDPTTFSNGSASNLIACFMLLAVSWAVTILFVMVGKSFVDKAFRLENMLIDNQKPIASEKKK